MIGKGDEVSRWVEEHGGCGKVVSGGSRGGSGWSQTRTVETESGRRFFVKTSSRPAELMFAGEAEGLRAMHATGTVMVPDVLYYGDFKESSGSFIVMEYMDLRGRYDQADLGRQLALVSESHLMQLNLFTIFRQLVYVS